MGFVWIIWGLLILFPLVYAVIKKPNHLLLYLAASYGIFTMVTALTLLLVNPLFLFEQNLLPQLNEYFRSKVFSSISGTIELFNTYVLYLPALLMPYIATRLTYRYSRIFLLVQNDEK